MKLHDASVQIAHARFVGRFPRLRGPGWVMVGQDGGQSIACNGRRIFCFSDTLLVCSGAAPSELADLAPVPVPTDLRTIFLSNCAAVTDGETLDDALGSLRYFSHPNGMPREVLPSDERDRFRRLRFWPEHGVSIGGRIYLYYLAIQATDESSVWGFRSLGSGLAELNPETGGSRRVVRRGNWLLWRNDAHDLHMGVQVVRRDDAVFVFGSVRRGLSCEGVLARVRADRIEDPDAYEFLASPAPTWRSSLDGATSLGPVSTGYSVSFNSHLNRYTLFYVDGYTRRLMLRTAPELWGPYTDPSAMFALPARPTSELLYLGFEHATYQQDGGRTVYVSYCEPHFAPASIVTVTLDSPGAHGAA